MTFDEWMRVGLDNGWAGPPVCYTHDGLPCSLEEEETDDHCIHIIRLYESNEHKLKVEDNHSPSVWRNSYDR